MSRFLVRLALVLSVFLVLGSCNRDIPDGTRGACETCKEDSDCKPGMTCELYCCFGPDRIPFLLCAGPSTCTRLVDGSQADNGYDFNFMMDQYGVFRLQEGGQ